MAKNKNTVRKDGRIASQVYIGMENGKRKYKTVYGKTQKEVDKKVIDLKIALQKGIDIAARNDTFEDWTKSWLTIKKSEVSYGRYMCYIYNAEKYHSLFPYSITKLKTYDFQRVILELAKKNPNTGKPTAAETLKQIKSTATQICRLAIENRVMDYNPVNAVKIPKSLPKEPKKALSQQQRHWICNTPHRMQLFAMIALYAGLRRGEALALNWSDIDLEKGTININKSIHFQGNTPILTHSAKNTTSIRIVYIPSILIDFLQKEKQNSKKNHSTLLFTTKSGNLMTQSSFRRGWESYMIELNLKYGTFLKQAKSKFQPQKIPLSIPYFTPHNLRHTFATMLYLSGVDIMTAKDQLGHANIQTTLNIYTHLDSEYKEKKIQKLDEFLNTEKTLVL